MNRKIKRGRWFIGLNLIEAGGWGLEAGGWWLEAEGWRLDNFKL